ncbi:hypothetical protein JQ594_15570 [Bradyrhizobium manausense]|nr:hypothetical protein [Bradyrhizobium manausense]MBR0687350.1 hypothetical protein [Bradyrhizobium manausense]
MQAYAFAELANGRLTRERGDTLSLFAMAVRGDAKELKKLIRGMNAE